MRCVGAALVAALLVAPAGCSLSGEDEPRLVAPDDVPFGLTESAAPTTTAAPAPSSTTTTVAVPAGPVAPARIYFVRNGGLVEVPRTLPVSSTGVVGASEALSALALGPLAAESGLRSPASGVIPRVSVDRGVATVELGPEFLTAIPIVDQRLAFGQIVMTLTGLAGIGQVRFTIDNEPQPAQRGDGAFAAVVSREDYEALTAPAG